jgi:L-ribulose-5-phosphate 4-epimerase
LLLADLRAEVVSVAKKMYESQLVRAVQGNLSVRDRETGLICITPSGADYQQLRPKDIVIVDEQGNVHEGEWAPSSETPLHTLILRQRRDIHCVMHTHSLYASAFSVVHRPMPVILAESAACLGGEVPVAPYMRSGTVEFAEFILALLGQGSAILWGNHGAMVVGPTLALTFSIAHALEDNARIYTIAKQLGTPITLPPEEVQAMHQHWQASYGQHHLQETK